MYRRRESRDLEKTGKISTSNGFEVFSRGFAPGASVRKKGIGITPWVNEGSRVEKRKGDRTPPAFPPTRENRSVGNPIG